MGARVVDCRQSTLFRTVTTFAMEILSASGLEKPFIARSRIKNWFIRPEQWQSYQRRGWTSLLSRGLASRTHLARALLATNEASNFVCCKKEQGYFPRIR